MKKALCVLLLACMLFGLAGCSAESGINEFVSPMFVPVVYGGNGFSIYYHQDTKVLYALYKSGNSCGITVLMNADGTPMVYQEEVAR